jgi:dCMP deaminase
MAERSTCPTNKGGAVIVKDRRMLVAGYAGSPAGAPHCDDVGCKQHIRGVCYISIHAVMNAIMQAARFGIPIEGGVLYSTCAPCYSCCAASGNVGLLQVIYEDESPIDTSPYIELRRIGE